MTRDSGVCYLESPFILANGFQLIERSGVQVISLSEIHIWAECIRDGVVYAVCI